MSFGRAFPLGKEGRYNLDVRAEFQNIFNRLFLPAPLTGASADPASVPTTVSGVYTGGCGAIATVGVAGARPRAGHAVARFTF